VSEAAGTVKPPEAIGATLLFSLLLHGVLLLGITFHFAKLRPSLPTLDVTLVNVANQEAPDKADFLAQANNRGGGQSNRAARPSQMFSGALPRPDPGIAPRPVEATTPPPRPATPARRITTRGRSDFSVASDTAQTEVDAQDPATAADLQRQQAIAQLAAELRRQTEALAKRPRKNSSRPIPRNTSTPATCAAGPTACSALATSITPTPRVSKSSMATCCLRWG
jgi:hypothetical protein